MTSPLARRGPAVALLFCVAAAAAGAQSNFAYYPDDNVAPNYAAPAGWYPWFTNLTGSRTQFLVPASAFAGVTSSGVDSIGFFLGASVPANTAATFSILQVRIGPAASPTLTGTFATNLVPGTETLVVDMPNSTFAANQLAWVDLPFSSPIPVPTAAIIVDIQTQIPAGGAYLHSSVSSSVPRCFAATFTGQATGTLSASSGSKMRFGVNPENILVLTTAGGGAGDLFLSLSQIAPSALTGFLLVSFDTSHPIGTGPALGIYPDATTFTILLGTPAGAGEPLHFILGYPGLFPDAPIVVPPGTLSFLGNTSWDVVAMLLDANDFYVGRSGVVRVFW